MLSNHSVCCSGLIFLACVRAQGLAAPCLNTISYLYFVCEFPAGDREGVTSLPQDPKADTVKRKKQLAEKQKDYRWSTKVRRQRSYYVALLSVALLYTVWK